MLPVQQLGRYFCLIPERIGLGLLSGKDYRDCCRFRFLKPVSVPDYRTAFAKSDRELYILGAMPFVYYVFDYSTTKFSMLLYSGNKVVVEFLAFAMCISYVIFLFVYFQEYELKTALNSTVSLPICS